MSGFTTARNELAGKLAAAGVSNPTIDPAALPPFTLVDLVRIDTNQGHGGWGGTVDISIVVPPPGDLIAATALEDQLELVLRTLGYAPAIPDIYTAGAKDCPSYTLTYPVTIPNPDC